MAAPPCTAYHCTAYHCGVCGHEESVRPSPTLHTACEVACEGSDGRLLEGTTAGRDDCWKGRLLEGTTAGRDDCWKGRLLEGRLLEGTTAGRDDCWKGRLLEAIRHTLATSTLHVRASDRRIHQQRGVRQGSPLSPVLFNVFMDDFPLSTLEVADGVLLDTLLYADDAAALASSVDEAATLLEAIHQWAADNKMRINARKSAVVAFGELGEDDCRRLERVAGRFDFSVLDKSEYLGIEYLGIEYLGIEYLGIELAASPAVSMVDHAVAHRRKKVQNTLASMTPFLCTRSIPSPIRIQAVKSVLWSSAAYGGEWFGMAHSRARKTDSIVLSA